MARGFQIIGLTPPGLTNPSIAIAASRAGGWGVLNLEHATDEVAARAAIERMAGYAGRACGIKLDGRAGDFITSVTANLPEQVEVVILTPSGTSAGLSAGTSAGLSAGCEHLREQVEMLHELNLTVLLECTCIEHARWGQAAGVDGLIAKGNEAGGWVGEETSFILLQRLLSEVDLPVWAHGGIGLHTAAACYAAGAAGVVLDAQLALTRESPLPEAVKDTIARMDGSETICLGDELGAACRMYARPGLPVIEELREKIAYCVLRTTEPSSTQYAIRSTQYEWHHAIRERVGWGPPEEHVWLVGQDAAFAAPLARQFRTVGGVLTAIRQAIDEHGQAAVTLQPLSEHSPLAQSHGTRYPIVQGPMTRVSDRAEFALRVAEGGALPFLALAMMRGPQVEALLKETQQLLGDRPWGVGILGFVPLNLRQKQLEVIRRYRPPFALIAGGRPDQARALEDAGIPTYLHVPSPGLLQMFLQEGARRFVFEGRECGGHVGPRSSFVLWNTMIDVLLEELPTPNTNTQYAVRNTQYAALRQGSGQVRNTDYHVLFAGGIHDALSAAMVAAMAAPLAERGVRVGVLLGTSYLFTEDAVASGAILPGFQEEAVRCDHTVLIETGPGHVIRCVETPYVSAFEQEKQRLIQAGKSPEEVREALEAMNVGRLRVASKGIDRHPHYSQDPQAPKYVPVDEEEQHRQGMYMIGQLAALRDQVCTIEELHRDVSTAGAERLEARFFQTSLVSKRHAERPSDVAIVGMACLLPKAPDLLTYWKNILNKVDAITEVPKDRWDWERYYDPDRTARDRVYSRWGGFLDEIPFDPTRYGIPPNALRSIEPAQLLTLEVVRAALEDAGYLDRDFPREYTSVILGAGGGIGDLGQQYFVRGSLPELFEDVPAEVLEQLPEWTEDSFPGILLNVIAGRVANRFDLGGVNYVVDAACASSLAALYQAVRELEIGTSDMVIVGGVENVQNPFAYLAFSKTRALSPRGRCRTFDDTADGIAISEGLAIVVLKRLADAERDGDRIYAVIKGVAGSSDGRDKSLTAPRPAGQARALERAYAKAGISPATVGLIEAHGTGTVVGDQAEVETLKRVFQPAGAAPQSCAIGSVKSMIGHTKCTAGVAGLIKVALALHHKLLPPTLGIDKPNTKARFEESPFYVNTEVRPWINGAGDHPRRAGVSAFGFGGTNFHAVLEEYTGDFLLPQATTRHWPSEIFLWSAPSRQALAEALASLEQALEQGARPELPDLAYTLLLTHDERQTTKVGVGRSSLVVDRDSSSPHLAIIATSLDDLRPKLAQAREALDAPGAVEIIDPRGIYYTEQLLARDGKVAFLFPGQGSQYPNMLRDLAIAFPEIREAFERADRVLAGRFPRPLSEYVFPRPAFNPAGERAQREALTRTNVAQPALGTADMALCRLLQTLGVHPDMVAGHSYGEYVALCAAGAMDEETLFRLSEARGRHIIEAARDDLGTMAAVRARPQAIAPLLESRTDVWIANLNAPEQTIISGTREGVAEVVQRLEAQGISAQSIRVACAFHSPLVAPAQRRLAEELSRVIFTSPGVQVFSNTTAAPYPDEPQAIAALLAEHLVRSVRFTDELEAMYAAGARLFVEVGPRNVLTGLTDQILGERPHVAITVDQPGRPGLTQLQHALGQLAIHGVPVQLDRLFQGRGVRRLNLQHLVEETAAEPLSSTTWLVNGGRARRPDEPVSPPHHPVKLVPMPERAEEQRSGGAGEQGSGGDGEVHPSTPAPQHFGTPSPPLPVSPSPDGAGQVMVQFQRLMDRFLESQREVMLSYLGSQPAGSPNGQVGEAADGGTAERSARQVIEPRDETPSRPHSQGMADHPLAQSPISNLQSPISAESVPEPQSAGPITTDGHLDREALTAQLLSIVSERTGYPTEMLDLDLDLEASLGIDSIKRVEIVGQLRQFLADAQWAERDLDMEGLSGLKTLREMIDRITDGRPTTDDERRTTNDERRTTNDERRMTNDQWLMSEDGAVAIGHQSSVEVGRLTLRAVERPLSTPPGSLAPGRVVLITDDETGVSQEVEARLREDGYLVALIRQHDEAMELRAGAYGADLRSPDSIERALELVRQAQGSPAGLIHLLPLSPHTPFENMDLPAWRERLALETRSLFVLAKALRRDLETAAEAGGAALIAATGLGGTFASTPIANQAGSTEQRAGGKGPGAGGNLQPATCNLQLAPGQGAIAGFLKTLAKEWLGVRVAAVDLDVREEVDALARHLLAELLADDGQSEVGYVEGRRIVLQPTLSPLPDGESNNTQYAIRDTPSNWVWLITGGARGITADVALELAQRYQPTLILVGRTPLPPAEESPDTVGLTTPPELKAALIERLRSQGQPVTPPQVEEVYRRLLKEREIRQNIAALTKTGAQVHYYAVDVRDEQAFGPLIGDIYQSFGRLDGVIHGAGIIEDKLVQDKPVASFDRVFSTKVESAFILSRYLRPESLRFLVFFSSVAGRFGNRGQSDYAAANEVLNKLAIYLDQRWPARVVSINWGPWEKRGMVSPELLEEFKRRGVVLVPPEAGRRMFDEEIRHGHKGEAEVIIGGAGRPV